MACLEELFRPICAEVEKELKKVLRGILTGPIAKGYLPQAWVFETGEETITFHVDKKGNASTDSVADPKPDVIIRIDHDYLAKALGTRSRPDFEPKVLEYIFHTGKGETAFGYMRKRLGL